MDPLAVAVPFVCTKTVSVGLMVKPCKAGDVSIDTVLLPSELEVATPLVDTLDDPV